MSNVVFKAIKKLVAKISKRPAPVEPTFEKKTLARAEAGMFIVTLEETGPDMFTVFVTGKLTKTGTGHLRSSKARATQVFNGTIGLYGGKDFI